MSELDLLAFFDDLTPKTTRNNPEPHQPLGLLVRQESRAWTTGELTHVAFFHLVITATQPLTDVHVGVYTELASGPKNSYTCWPPTSSFECSGGLGSWYANSWLEYDAPLRLLREHYCAASPPPGACNLGVTPYWIGVKMLTEPTAGRPVTLAAWDWNPVSADRDTDAERYALMSAGTIADVAAFTPGLYAPAEVLAIGPFPAMAIGDSIAVDVAFVGGSDVAAIQANAERAQEVFDNGYTSTALALVEARAGPNRVSLVWHSIDPAVAGATVQRREAEGDWSVVGAVRSEDDRLLYEDLDVQPGRRYGYRLNWWTAEGERFEGETWVETPLGASFALHGSRPNPIERGDLVASFSLPAPGAAALALYDLAGRRILERSFAGLGAGNHLVNLGSTASLPPGAYQLALAQAGRRDSRRVVVIR